MSSLQFVDPDMNDFQICFISEDNTYRPLEQMRISLK